MKLLDCTLRDGGYYTNWNFDSDMVRELITAIDMSGVSVMELGYKSPIKGGPYRKCNDNFIWGVLNYKLPENLKLAFMIDAKDFIKNKQVDFSLLNDVVLSSERSPFSICRLALKYEDIELSKEIIKYLISKQYNVMVNLMGVSLLSNSQIKYFVEEIKELEIECLYFADSYGNLTPSEIVDLSKYKNQINIGIHTHDNLGLGFANSIVASESGFNYIDATLFGMGRGVGNAKLEQLVTYYQNKNLDNCYSSAPLQKVIRNWMRPLHEKYGWGFTYNYMKSGLKNIHPLYVQNLQQSYNIPEKIEKILDNIPNASVFDKSNIEKYLIPKVAVVIPARFKSTRFPGKPLAKIKGKEMILWVADVAKKSVGIDNVYVATENEDIVSVVKNNGYKVILTSDNCLTGTDRVAEASLEIDADIIINIQGDEPLLNSADILKVIETKIQFPNHIINCMSYLTKHENVHDKKIPKIITNLNDELIWCSRNALPGTKTGEVGRPKKQICIYAFTKKELHEFSNYKNKTPLEAQEDIEINRFIELGHKVKMLMLDNESYAVDYPEDIEFVENIIEQRNN